MLTGSWRSCMPTLDSMSTRNTLKRLYSACSCSGHSGQVSLTRRRTYCLSAEQASYTALLKATETGNADIVKALLEYGASPDIGAGWVCVCIDANVFVPHSTIFFRNHSPTQRTLSPANPVSGLEDLKSTH